MEKIRCIWEHNGNDTMLYAEKLAVVVLFSFVYNDDMCDRENRD